MGALDFVFHETYTPPMNRPYTTRSARYAALALAALATWALSTCAEAMPGDRRPADGMCEWRAPGSDRYMQPLGQAVDRLTYIPADVRATLKQRLADPRKHVNADDHILMTAASVVGEAGQWLVRDMNAGRGQVCWGEVTRATWQPGQAERALVFCEQGWCVAYFSVCRNIATAVLVQPRAPITPDVPGGGGGGGDKGYEDPQGKGLRARMPYGIDITWEDIAQLDLVPVRVATPETLLWPEWGVPYRPFAVRTAPLNSLADETVPVVPAPVAPIPEPSTLALLLAGLGLIVLARRVQA